EKVPPDSQQLITPQIWLTGARGEGLVFAWEQKGNLGEIAERMQEIESRIADPERLNDSMRPGTSTRIYAEGYLAGLKDAVAIISALPGNGRQSSPPPEQL